MLHKKRTPLDCAIVDIRLLDMDRLKLLKVIEVDYPNLPVIIITGHGGPAIEEAARAQNADGYLEKPFAVEEFTRLPAEIPAPAAKAETAKAEAVAPAQSIGAYALVTVDTAANLMGVYQKLYFHENVLYCDAVKGDHYIILLLQADSFGTLHMETDVVSPASLPIETQGTLTACDRRMQANMKVFGSKTGMENWEIIADMALKIGAAPGLKPAEDIQKEIRRIVVPYRDRKAGSALCPSISPRTTWTRSRMYRVRIISASR